MANSSFQFALGLFRPSQQNRNPVGRNLIAAIAVVSGAFSLIASHVSADIPRGVFSLSTSGKPCSDTVLANPDVTGVSIRYPWFSLEPTEGDFDWTFLDAEVARIGAAGKQVLLRIGSMSGRPEWVTTAVRRAGGKFFTFDDNGV